MGRPTLGAHAFLAVVPHTHPLATAAPPRASQLISPCTYVCLGVPVNVPLGSTEVRSAR